MMKIGGYEQTIPIIGTYYYAVQNRNGWGYYDCGEFEQARTVQNGVARVKKEGEWGVIKIPIK